MRIRCRQVLEPWSVLGAAWMLIATQMNLWAATPFVHETVDATADVGQHASLVLDSQGNPSIAYYDATNAALKYASAAVELNSPAAAWTIGASHTVTWQGTGPVDLSISRDGGATWTLLASRLAGGSYRLEVPNIVTQFAKLRLERAIPYSVAVTTGFFTIGAP